jgi:hypothetical protein
MPPALFGWGLLEAVPEGFLRNLADPQDANGDGISGRLHRVLELAEQRFAVVRFGWKAEQPTLRQQTAAALFNDMGITTTLSPGADGGALPESRLPARRPRPGPDGSGRLARRRGRGGPRPDPGAGCAGADGVAGVFGIPIAVVLVAHAP